jgi:uncharacterized protein
MRRLSFAALVLAACSSEDPGNATFRFRASVEQVHVWKARPGATLELEREGAGVQRGVADELGSLVFRKVPPGHGYRVRSGEEYSAALHVKDVAESLPPREFYTRQKLGPGFQYLETRDGTKLSVYVTIPGPVEDGPYPTVVNYSGYSPSRPGEPLGDFEVLCGELPALCDAPDSGDSLFAALAGYATVNVNMRGTGCSGGAYDYFEMLQVLDGYDVIEIAAAQEWVLHGKVGMVGLSFPGISQLFVARARPPGLAAITPLSVIGSTATTLRPGGLLNVGFALNWVEAVLDKARPYGKGWERARVDAGDSTCEENQLLHSQRVDNVQQARETPFYVPELIDPLNPTLWVHEIEVPVFLAGAWQDEQTGPWFGTLLDRFNGSPDVRILVQNGVHIDAFAPAIFAEWKAFLDLFVARQVPAIPGAVRGLAPTLFAEVFDASLDLPPERFSRHRNHEAALAAWRAEPKVRLLFESGAGNARFPGAPVASFTHDAARWPPPELRAHRWFLRPDGSLGDAPPTSPAAASEFVHDADAGGRVILGRGAGIWSRSPAYVWRQPAAGSAVVFDSAPLASDLVMAGTGSVDLWIRSTATEADLEVSLSELRPDGREMYVQSGWLRASLRALAPDATELLPALTKLEADAAPLVPGEWTQVRIALSPFAHAFRAGSRIRLQVDTPGDSRAEWKFELAPVPADTRIAVAHDAARPSSIALPTLEGVVAGAPLPPCTIRGQQCREAVTYENVAAP